MLRRRKQVAEKRLRNGYTTGTCAAAAAKAAAAFLVHRKLHPMNQNAPRGCALDAEADGCQSNRVSARESGKPDSFSLCGKPGTGYSELTLPGGTVCRIPVTRHEPEQETESPAACFFVQKDSGDDPDVTNGTRVFASVRQAGRNEFESLCQTGAGYYLEEYPQLYLNGGPGIGMVTKPGLSCPVGHYAINPVPRSMILGAVEDVVQTAAFEEYLIVTIWIPEGEALALQTFNPKLGIQGGISLLGTTGIVKPMSEEALLETIHLEIHMKAVNGAKVLLMAPGNYGEEFLKKELGVPMGSAVRCSNFVKEAVLMAEKEGFRKLLFVGHIGKLIKVSAGVENTHSKYGDGRMEQMAVLIKELGHPELQEEVRSCNTTDDALALLKEQGLAKPLLVLTAACVKRWIETWSGGRIAAEAVTFSTAHQILGATKNWQKAFDTWQETSSGQGNL